MNKYIVEGFETKELASYIEKSPCKRFIQELNFKFGLKVLDLDTKPWAGITEKFFLTESSGAFVVATIFLEKDGENIIYNYRSPYYRKERGSGSADRETLHSKKLSTLMATLKRNEVVPPLDGMIKMRHEDCFRSAVQDFSSHHGNINKRVSLESDEIHSLLRQVFRGEDAHQITLNKCKEILDKYDEIDKIKDVRDKDIARFFDNGFYAIGADSFNHLVVGVLKKNDKDRKFDVVKPFKRVKDLSEYEDIQPIMLMLKVFSQNKYEGEKLYGSYLPQKNDYLPDLDVMLACCRSTDEYNLTWAMFPC
jgi:hypothetical protein